MQNYKSAFLAIALIGAVIVVALLLASSCTPLPVTIDRSEPQACFDYQYYREAYPRTSCWHHWNECVDMELRVRESPHIYRVINPCHWY